MKVTVDDVYAMIVLGDIYVDLYAAPVIERELTRVFETVAQADCLAPDRAVTCRSFPKVKSVEVSDGARVLWGSNVFEIANVSGEGLWLHGGKRPVEFTHESFDEMVKLEKIKLVEMQNDSDPCSEGLRRLDNAEPKIRAEADRRYEIIKPYLNGEKRLRGAKRERSIRRYIANFKEAQKIFQNGLVGLLADWGGRGNREKRLTDKVYGHMNYGVKIYEGPTQKSIFEVYGEVLNHCVADGIPVEERPSYATFRNLIQSRPLDEQTTNRQGRRAGYKHQIDIFWIEADTPPHGDRPFEIAHADHTELDIELKCPITGQNLGRPWASFLVCAYSRRLLAIVVTFDPPSYRSVMMLIRECVRRWRRLPQTIIVDGGPEFDSLYFRRLAGSLQITIKQRPPGKPRHGSVGERLFGTAHDNFVHLLAGNTQLMTEVRKVTKSVNPKNLAEWELGQFTEWLTAWGYYFYDKNPHWTLKQSPEDAFNRSVLLTGSRRRLIPYNEHFLLMTMPTTRKMTAKNVVDKGVKVKSVFYRCSELNDRTLHGKQIPVRFDPFNTSRAFVYVNKHWAECHSEHYTTFKYCTERQLKIVSAEIRKRDLQYWRGRSITAHHLAEFILSAEKSLHDPGAVALMRQRVHDREVSRFYRWIDSGADGKIYFAEPSASQPVPATESLEHGITPSSNQSQIDVDSIGVFPELN